MNRDGFVAAWSRLLRASTEQIEILLKRGPYLYKHYQIPKRTGGMRDIYHPTPNLKAIQRWLVANCFSSLPVHDNVYSYRKGRCIRGHATVHLHSNFLLRLDFTDFFPSIDYDWLQLFLLNQVKSGALEISANAVPDILRMICRFDNRTESLALSIGAPSSPILSNAILFDADSTAAKRCAEMECIYTRYADDIYISTRDKDILAPAEKIVRDIFLECTPKLRFNEKKTLNVSKKSRRVVTGVTLASDRNISVGRKLKRQIKTEVFLWSNGTLQSEKTSHLCGLISFVRDVEPEFFESLCKKFGNTAMEKLFRNTPRQELWKEIPF